MKHHTITIEEVNAFLDSENSFKTFASSSTEAKELQVLVGDQWYRVLHGREIVYEGKSRIVAVKTYNDITTKPEETVKLDN